jgi:hypothetical protein
MWQMREGNDGKYWTKQGKRQTATGENRRRDWQKENFKEMKPLAQGRQI